MKLEVGMYVRTKDDGIQKITKVTENGCFYRTCRAGFEYKTSLSDKEDVIAVSHSLLGNNGEPCLIKVGDYVNDYPVYFLIDNQEPKMITTENGCLSEREIETIVTKEQFENSSFKVSD